MTQALADVCMETISCVCVPVCCVLLILILKQEHRGNNLLSEQPYILPTVFLALSGILAPNKTVQQLFQQIFPDFWKGGAVGSGTEGRKKPTSHTVLLCIRVCRHTSWLLLPQHSQWQSYRETRKVPQCKQNPKGPLSSMTKTGIHEVKIETLCEKCLE